MMRGLNVRCGGQMAAVVSMAVALSVAAVGEVDLLFAPLEQSAAPDAVVEIDLVARSDNDQTQGVATVEAIFHWDPAVLDFLGVDNSNADYAFMTADFMPDPDGINDDLTDGDALFVALAPGGQEAPATPAGIVVTTLRFAPVTWPAVTTVSLLPTLGEFGVTRVLRLETPRDITGDVSGTADVAVVVCDSADCDVDGDVDLADFAKFQQCYEGADSAPGITCECLYDFEPDEDVDFDDFATLETMMLGPGT